MKIGVMGGVIGEGLAHIKVIGGRQADGGAGDMRLIALTISIQFLYIAVGVKTGILDIRENQLTSISSRLSC
jgi:hypothetical protein